MTFLASTFDPADGADPRAVLAGALAWWADAGVDEPLSVLPRAWLDRPAVIRVPRAVVAEAPASAPEPAHHPSAKPAPTSAPVEWGDLPADLPAFRAWLATAPLPGLPENGERVVGEGAEAAAVAIVIARPAERSQLLDPARRRVFEGMMRVAGLPLGDLALIPVVPSAAGPMPTGTVAATFRPLLSHHLRLLGARRVLLLGDGPCRTLLDGPAARLRGDWHFVNHIGGGRAMASLDLDLLAQPACKREAWADLLRFMDEEAGS